MARSKDINTQNPWLDLVAAFWIQVKKDLSGEGTICGDLPDPEEEARILADEALEFVGSADFEHWSNLSGVEPEVMRSHLCLQ